MKNRRIKNSLTAFAVLALIFIICVPCYAENPADIDLDKKGSLSLTLSDKDTGEKLSGVELSLIKTASLTYKNGSLAYEAEEDFLNWSFDGTLDAALASELSEYALKNALTLDSRSTDNDGTVLYSELEPGIYLIMQTGLCEGYSSISPFLAAVPENEDGEWNYDVKGTPKLEAQTENSKMHITVLKKWDDGENTNVSHSGIKVTLFSGTAAVETVTLSAENDWTYTWEELSESNQWQVLEESVPEGYTASYERTLDGKGYIVTVTNKYEEEEPTTKPEETESSSENPTNPTSSSTPENPENPSSPKTDTKELPYTGQLTWPIPFLAVLGMIVFGIGFALKFSKRERQ